MKPPRLPDLRKFFRLSLSQRIAIALVRLAPQHIRHQLVATLADLNLDPIAGDAIPVPLKRDPPSLDMSRVGIDQRTVNVEDQRIQCHGGHWSRSPSGAARAKSAKPARLQRPRASRQR